MNRKSAILTIWFISGLFLILLLLWTMDVSFSQLITSLSVVPWWTYLIVGFLTAGNQVVGALKWRTARGWLAPRSKKPSMVDMVESTSVGSFFGQLVPPQISTAIARWVIAEPDERRDGAVLGSTLFEQLFDLPVLLAAGLAGMTAIALGLGAGMSLAVLCATLIASVGLLRHVLGGLRIAITAITGTLALQRTQDSFRDGFLRAEAAPASVTFKLSLLSVIRLLIVGSRAVIVTMIFAPAAAPMVIVAGYPIIGLVTALPITPAGLGVVEWTWSGILIQAGATAESAVIAALGLRLINLVALSTILMVFVGLRLLRRGK